MSITGYLDPKNDFAFKQIFGQAKNNDILIHFLNDILKLTGDSKIKKTKFISTIQEPDIAVNKQSVVDVLCKDARGRQFVIEMQVANKSGFKQRAVYYASKAYVSQMKKGGMYEDLQEVIFIAIINYSLFTDKEDYHSSHGILDLKTHQHDLTGLRFEFLELPCFKKKLNQLNTMIEKWCYFFKHAADTDPKDLKKIISEDRIFKKAYTALTAAYWTEDDLNKYEKSEKNRCDRRSEIQYALDEGKKEGKQMGLEAGEKIGIEKGKQIGIEEGEKIGVEKGEKIGIEKGKAEGIAIGARQTLINTARALKKLKLSNAQIQQATQLSIDEIENLGR